MEKIPNCSKGLNSNDWILFIYYSLSYSCHTNCYHLIPAYFDSSRISQGHLFKFISTHTIQLGSAPGHWTGQSCIYYLFFLLKLNHTWTTGSRSMKMGTGHNNITLMNNISLIWHPLLGKVNRFLLIEFYWSYYLYDL